ncbi:MAG: hypothetical protein L0226_07520 [Acidobacteria bacterium]|nr:hypothetical protein [Acidobacteriota bacterium]
MQRRNIGLILLAIAVGLVGLLTVQAQRKAGRRVILPNDAQRIAATNYTLSGPYSYNNLSIFLIHGQDNSKGKPPLTLKEAMAQKKVVVHETGEVNQLAIENVSQEEVFVQSGDIVKGGQQDRVLAFDLVVPAKSGKMPIESFCVEQGRWSRRGEEVVTAFSSSDKMLNSKDLKIAAKEKASQGEVWDNVAKSQRKLSAGVLAASSPAASAPAPHQSPVSGGGGGSGAGAGGSTGRGGSYGFSVASSISSSSLQLSLENKSLQDTAKGFIKKLSPIIERKSDVIGYAFAINGEINSADVYSSHALFKKFWPKLLESSAIEAIGEFEKDRTYKSPTTDAIKTFLNEAEDGKADAKKVTSRVTVIKRETGKNLFFETRDRKNDGEWIHRNYITK